jgi:hypothetical protein
MWDLQDPEGREIGLWWDTAQDSARKTSSSTIQQWQNMPSNRATASNSKIWQQSHLQSHICLHQNFNRKVNYQISSGSKIMICMWKEWEGCLKSLQLMCLCRTHLQSLESWSNPLFGTNFFPIPVILAHIPHKCSPIIPPLNLPQEKRMALLRFACCSTSYWIMFNAQTADMYISIRKNPWVIPPLWWKRQ